MSWHLYQCISTKIIDPPLVNSWSRNATWKPTPLRCQCLWSIHKLVSVVCLWCASWCIDWHLDQYDDEIRLLFFVLPSKLVIQDTNYTLLISVSPCFLFFCSVWDQSCSLIREMILNLVSWEVLKWNIIHMDLSEFPFKSQCMLQILFWF